MTYCLVSPYCFLHTSIHLLFWPTMPLQVIDHYEHPRNVGSLDKSDINVGTGLVGAPACGDVMKLQVGGVTACSLLVSY